MVGGENFADVHPAHGVHRDAVGQGVFLVLARGEKADASPERFSRLRDHLHVRILHDLLGELDRFAPSL